MNNTENSRNKRRDAKHRQRYKPVRLGLPQGLTKAQWISKKLKEQQKKKDDESENPHRPLCFIMNWILLPYFCVLTGHLFSLHTC